MALISPVTLGLSTVQFDRCAVVAFGNYTVATPLTGPKPGITVRVRFVEDGKTTTATDFITVEIDNAAWSSANIYDNYGDICTVYIFYGSSPKVARVFSGKTKAIYVESSNPNGKTVIEMYPGNTGEDSQLSSGLYAYKAAWFTAQDVFAPIAGAVSSVLKGVNSEESFGESVAGVVQSFVGLSNPTDESYALKGNLLDGIAYLTKGDVNKTITVESSDFSLGTYTFKEYCVSLAAMLGCGLIFDAGAIFGKVEYNWVIPEGIIRGAFKLVETAKRMISATVRFQMSLGFGEFYNYNDQSGVRRLRDEFGMEQSDTTTPGYGAIPIGEAGDLISIKFNMSGDMVVFANGETTGDQKNAHYLTAINSVEVSGGVVYVNAPWDLYVDVGDTVNVPTTYIKGRSVTPLISALTTTGTFAEDMENTESFRVISIEAVWSTNTNENSMRLMCTKVHTFNVESYNEPAEEEVKLTIKMYNEGSDLPEQIPSYEPTFNPAPDVSEKQPGIPQDDPEIPRRFTTTPTVVETTRPPKKKEEKPAIIIESSPIRDVFDKYKESIVDKLTAIVSFDISKNWAPTGAVNDGRHFYRTANGVPKPRLAFGTYWYFNCKTPKGLNTAPLMQMRFEIVKQDKTIDYENARTSQTLRNFFTDAMFCITALITYHKAIEHNGIEGSVTIDGTFISQSYFNQYKSTTPLRYYTLEQPGEPTDGEFFWDSIEWVKTEGMIDSMVNFFNDLADANGKKDSKGNVDTLSDHGIDLTPATLKKFASALEAWFACKGG